MPLPLPNLDTRRWSDLVDEGRAIIPRYAPAWTDHNVHDPGIMVIELLAWLVESLMYRANRITDRDRRKFLSLVGYAPQPPEPARTTLGCALALGSGVVTLPSGVVFVADDGAGGSLSFTTTAPASLVEASLVALQQFDGATFLDRTRALRDELPLPLFGVNPAVPVPYDALTAPAFYLGFDLALPPGAAVTIHAAMQGSVAAEREALLAEAAAAAALCAPKPPLNCVPCVRADPWCADASPPGAVPGALAGGSSIPPLPPHHAVRLAWEWLASDGWHALDATAGDVIDDTRSLTLDGDITLRFPGAMIPGVIGAVSAPRFWIRCRMVKGPYESAPVALALIMNAVAVEQWADAFATYAIASATAVTGTITVGARQTLAFDLDATGTITSLAVVTAPTANAIDALVLAYTPSAALTPGAITLSLEAAGIGTGVPEDVVALAASPVSRGVARVWSVEPAGARTWQLSPDFDASRRTDATAVLHAEDGSISFGDGDRGRVPPAGAAILAAYAATSGVRGNIAPGRAWTLASSPMNTALLGTPAAIAAALDSIENPIAATGGADEESMDHAAGRAVSALWAHERLVQLSPIGVTLDQLDSDDVLAVDTPARATNLLDFERIARGVPGTRVRRARAWARLDSNVPCADASGTVTVVIVPELPLGAPTPSGGLIRAVRSYLDRRRVLCTRLLVVAPQYVIVSVTATVEALAGANPGRVAIDIRSALTIFLDPILGGPAGRGWPFGRDVFRSEVLALIDGVPGVDHVTSLELSAEGCDPQCNNICVSPTSLVASGLHSITMGSA
jgi:predicted phage baseplate assembly protein